MNFNFNNHLPSIIKTGKRAAALYWIKLFMAYRATYKHVITILYVSVEYVHRKMYSMLPAERGGMGVGIISYRKLIK